MGCNTCCHCSHNFNNEPLTMNKRVEGGTMCSCSPAWFHHHHWDTWLLITGLLCSAKTISSSSFTWPLPQAAGLVQDHPPSSGALALRRLWLKGRARSRQPVGREALVYQQDVTVGPVREQRE